MLSVIWLYHERIIDLLEECNLFILEDGNKDKLLDIYIPRIKLRKSVYNIDSGLNDVAYNVEILRSSSIQDDLYFLAAHSGSGSVSYFDNLICMEKGDIIYIFIGDRKRIFVVDALFYIQKNGYFYVDYGSGGKELFLITCSLKYVNRQLVVRAKLIYKC